MYGNIDEEGLHRSIASNNEDLIRCIKRSKELDEQLEVLNRCKKSSEK